ncbi:lipopolysaccharide biosynthesis protein, partial [Rubrivivax gelatinosus]
QHPPCPPAAAGTGRGLNPTMDIEEAKRRARSGPLLLLARRAAALVVTFVSTITVARLLSPHEFGLATMSTVILSFAAIFRDFGLTNAVLRKGVISQAELSLIFWFNAGMTILLSLLIAATAPLAARFFGEPAVLGVILVSLIAFLLSGLCAQHQALVNRELRFAVVAVADIVAVVAGFATTLAVALVTRDVWAIVYGNLVQTVCSAAIYVGASRWVPGRPRRHEELGDLLRFGANSSVYSISVFVSNNAAAVLIGHYLGSNTLGQYNRAQALYSLPHANLIQPITQAVMPLLTRLRPHPQEYREAYLGLVRKLCVFLMPLSVVLSFAAVPLVETLLGPGWHTAGLVFAALAPAMFAVGFSYAVGDLFVTQNRSAELRRQGLVDLVLRVSCIAVGVRYGVIGAALGFTVSSVLVGVLRVWVAGRSGPVGTADQFRAATAGLPLAAGSGLGCGALWALMPTLDGAVGAALLLSVGSLSALLAGLAVPSSRQALHELAELFGLARLLARVRRRR